MRITSFSPEEFDRLEGAWRSLEDGKDMTGFQLYDWYRNINRLYFRERAKRLFRSWFYLLVEDDQGAPVMIAPLQYVRFGANYKCVGLHRGFYFIGRQGYSDYLNFIYREFSEAAFEGICRHLRNEFHCGYFQLEQLLESTDCFRYVSCSFKCTMSRCYCVDLVLPDSFEEYRSFLSKHMRQNLRTALNRQSRNAVALTHEMFPDVDDRLKDVLYEIRAQRLGDKQRRARARASWKARIYHRLRDLMGKVFNATHDVLSQSCNPWLFVVRHADRIVGYFWGIRHPSHGDYYVILAGVDREYAWYSPTLSHFYLYVKELYENGGDRQVRSFDFTRGGEHYKEDMGGKRKDAMTIVFRTGPHGRTGDPSIHPDD